MDDNDRKRQYPNSPDISKKETEQALRNVHRRLGFSEKEKLSKNGTGQLRPPISTWLLAAVVLFTALGAGLLLYPVTVSVPYGERLTHELPDGSTIELNSDSEIEYRRTYGWLNRSIAFRGEGFISVEAGRHPFRVQAGESVIEVTGTRFNLRFRGEELDRGTTVAVLSGSVNLYAADSPESRVSISQGEMSRLEPAYLQPDPPEPIRTEEVLAWRDRNLSFVEQPVRRILRELERTFDIEIKVDAEEVLNRVLTSYYREPEDVERILSDIATVTGMTYSRTSNGYHLTSAPEDHETDS